MEGQQTARAFFTELERRLAEWEPKDVYKLRRDRWVALIMLLGVALTVPSILGAKHEVVGWLTLVGIVLELCGLGVLAYRQIRDVAPEFVDAKRKFAVELDAHFIQYQALLQWLRAQSVGEVRRRLAYVESRLDAMSLRYPIVFGAVDKLGLLPLLAGIFVQVQAINRVSPLIAIFAIAIFMLYGMALWMARYRLQMQAYARVLSAAIRSEDKEGGQASSQGATPAADSAFRPAWTSALQRRHGELAVRVESCGPRSSTP
jgi:hypothetical protein